MKLTDILLMLENDICGLGYPLQKAFVRLSEERCSGAWTPLFVSLSHIMTSRSCDAGSAWKQALEETAAALPLDEAELAPMRDFGEMLGKSDREMQMAVLNLEKKKVMAMEQAAREAQDTYGKLYRKMGALIGAAAVILLI